MKKAIFFIVFLLILSLFVCSCTESTDKTTDGSTSESVQSSEPSEEQSEGSGDTEASELHTGSEPTDPTEEPTEEPTEKPTVSAEPTEPSTSVTESTEATEPSSEEPTEPEDYEEFVDQNFGDHGEDGEYHYKEEVGGKPVTEFGVVGENGEQSYTTDDPDAPVVHRPSTEPTGSQSTDPTEPTDPTEEPTEEPTEKPTVSTEPTEPSTSATEPTDPVEPTDPKPVAPKDMYAVAIGNIDDYIANVQYKCEVELTDGSVTKYVYKYSVMKSGDVYAATYMDKGEEKTAIFDSVEGIMTVGGKEKYVTLADFYRFCSMVEPLPLKVYFYEHSEAGTDFSAKMNAEDHRDLLLNTSPLFTGFDKMDGVEMGKLYYNGHVNSDGEYIGSELAFDMSYNEKSLGKMLFRVSIEVDYEL